MRFPAGTRSHHILHGLEPQTCFSALAHVDSVAHGVNKSDDNFGDGYRLQDFASLAISHSTPAHYNGDLGPDTFLIIGVKGASYRAARASLFHYLGP